MNLSVAPTPSAYSLRPSIFGELRASVERLRTIPPRQHLLIDTPDAAVCAIEHARRAYRDLIEEAKILEDLLDLAEPVSEIPPCEAHGGPQTREKGCRSCDCFGTP